MPWFITLLLGIALQILGYLLAPQPKREKPAAAQDLQDPTAEAGRPIPVLFGTMTITGVNVLWFGDKKVIEYEVSA